MDWIVISLIVISSSVVVCLGGVYYRLFYDSPLPLAKQQVAKYEPPTITFDSVYSQKI